MFNRSLPPPTTEQAAVANHPLLPGALIIAEAFAGAGKTTTLQHVARTHAGRKILYLCFNRANADEAKKKMPSNVSVATIHGLAFRYVGQRYREKLGDIRPREVKDILSLPDSATSMAVIQTIGNFLRTLLPEPTRACVPVGGVKADADRVVHLAKRLWARMVDPADHAVRIPHDGYLKLWLQTEPILREFDLVMVDEAQDLEPLAMQFALRQQKSGQAAVIMVGDTHQSIYSWRGAINAMEKCAKLADERFIISECFRFPQAHADAAAAVLRRIKGIHPPLKGKGSGDWLKEPTRAVLARTNARLISKALSHKGALHFAGTSPKDAFSPKVPYKFQEMRDVVHILKRQPERVQTAYLRRFSDFDDLMDFASGGGGGESQDVELLSLVRLAQEHGNHLHHMLDDIEERAGESVPEALHLSSGHRSKGLQFGQVELLDDFLPVFDSSALMQFKFKLTPTQFTEEANLLYVAMTRACARLDIISPFEAWLRNEGVVLPRPACATPIAGAPVGRSYPKPADQVSIMPPRPAPSERGKQVAGKAPARAGTGSGVEQLPLF